jgi:hypothetical protein
MVCVFSCAQRGSEACLHLYQYHYLRSVGKLRILNFKQIYEMCGVLYKREWLTMRVVRGIVKKGLKRVKHVESV